MPQFDVAYVRNQFPALRRIVDGHPAAYLDGPGGTQTPQRVLDAVRDYLADHNCNIHGAFATGEETDAIIHERPGGRRRLPRLRLGRGQLRRQHDDPHLPARRGASPASMRPGDEVVITELDHEANRGPWLRLAERGVVVREVPVDLATCTLDWEAFERLVKPGKTKVVAVGYASNAVGTVNDVARAAALAREAGASERRRRRALRAARPDRRARHRLRLPALLGVQVLRPARRPHVRAPRGHREGRAAPAAHAGARPAVRVETGTLNHEGIAGTAAAVDFIADLGERHLAMVEDRLPAGLQGRRRAIVAGMLAGEAYEQPLATRLREQLAGTAGVTIYGPPEGSPRTSTVSFTLDGFQAGEVCRALGARGLFVWDGDFYALRLSSGSAWSSAAAWCASASPRTPPRASSNGSSPPSATSRGRCDERRPRDAGRLAPGRQHRCRLRR